MPNLLSLELHGNGLSGELPSEMYDASKIQHLNVAMQYQYAFQCQMSNGTLVNTLYERGGVVGEGQERVFNAGLSGKVLGPAVNKWTSMKGLHLFDNSFYGNMTDNLGDLKYLGEYACLVVVFCVTWGVQNRLLTFPLFALPSISYTTIQCFSELTIMSSPAWSPLA